MLLFIYVPELSHGENLPDKHHYGIAPLHLSIPPSYLGLPTSMLAKSSPWMILQANMFYTDFDGHHFRRARVRSESGASPERVRGIKNLVLFFSYAYLSGAAAGGGHPFNVMSAWRAPDTTIAAVWVAGEHGESRGEEGFHWRITLVSDDMHHIPPQPLLCSVALLIGLGLAVNDAVCRETEINRLN